MAGKEQRLKLSYSDFAERRLSAIWSRNADDYGAAPADRYIAFLRAETDKLAQDRLFVQPVPGSNKHFFVRLRRPGSRGHFHIVVIQIKGDTLRIIDFHHTAQDWASLYESDDE